MAPAPLVAHRRPPLRLFIQRMIVPPTILSFCDWHCPLGVAVSCSPHLPIQKLKLPLEMQPIEEEEASGPQDAVSEIKKDSSLAFQFNLLLFHVSLQCTLSSA